MEVAPLYNDMAEGPAGGYARWVRAKDGVALRVALWPTAGPQGAGTILLFPGRTEYIEKYGRTATALTQQGYTVVTIDWRGQGLTGRMGASDATGHVDQFSDYQLDVQALLSFVRAEGVQGPVFLLAHSMGGAIGLRALIEGLEVSAAMFSGPMWGISLSPVIRPLAWSMGWLTSQIGISDHMALKLHQPDEVELEPFEGNLLTTDAEMFAYMQGHVRAVPHLALGSPSYRWAYEALSACRAMAALPSPKIPALTWLGGDEGIVSPDAIIDRMRRWPGGRLEMTPGARHEVLMEKPAWRDRVIEETVAFFRNHTP